MMMKYISLLALLISTIASSCPTCVGRIEADSPPFFSDDFYKPDSQNIDDFAQTETDEEGNEKN